MEQKKYTTAGTDIEEVKKLNAASGLSYNDVLARLAQKTEVATIDEIPLNSFRQNTDVDSTSKKLNQTSGNGHLNRNGPK